MGWLWSYTYSYVGPDKKEKEREGDVFLIMQDKHLKEAWWCRLIGLIMDTN